MCCPRDADASNSWLQLREKKSQQAPGVENECAEESLCTADNGWALSMQTPSECIPSQFSGASSELPLRGSDATLSLDQSPYPVLFLNHCKWCSGYASPSSSRPLLTPVSLVCLPSLPLPHFLQPHRRHAFWTTAFKIEGFPVYVQEGMLHHNCLPLAPSVPGVFYALCPCTAFLCGWNAAVKSKMAVWTSGQCWMRGEASAAVPWDTNAGSKPSLLIGLSILI